MSEITTEVFAVGTWNGLTFTDRDLHDIVASFQKLGDLLKVPLKMGHNDEQPLTDGQPALGWVSDLWVDGKKLMAKMTDVPDVVRKAIEKKLYRKVSVELDFDVDHPRGKFDMVLSAIALLGADIPAVSTLSDLDAFMSRCRFSAGRHASFSAIAGNAEEDTNMKVEEQLMELTSRFDRLDSELAEAKAKLTTAEAENATLKAQVAEFTKAEDDRKASEAKAAVELARASVTDLLEGAVKDERISPAQRENFSKMLGVDDDQRVASIDIEALKSMIGESKSSFGRGPMARTGSSDDSGKTPSQVVAQRTQDLMDTDKSMSYSIAMSRVLQKDPTLADAYKYASDLT